MKKPQDAVQFPCGLTMKNRFTLAPMTNTQSHSDGTLSPEELHWLTMRAKGQFGMIKTCASHVQANGQGFPGQLGLWNEAQMDGHRELTKAIQSHKSLAVIQLFHGGERADPALITGSPVSSSSNADKGVIGLTIEEVRKLRDDFILAAKRAKECGYHGVEIHGAHGYILAQFLSPTINRRDDEYGRSLRSRARLIFEIIEGIRNVCGQEFLLGVRLSPERFGMILSEIKTFSQQLIDTGQIDYLDISLWDCYKYPHEETQKEKTLLQHFETLQFRDVIFSVAGNIRSRKDVHHILNTNVDALSIGRAAILHHDFPDRIINDERFEPVSIPVTQSYLADQGLSPAFIEYMRRWKGFVSS